MGSKKAIKLILTAMISGIILIGVFDICRIRTMTHLAENDLEWINCYCPNEKVLFKSDDGQIDTMFIMRKLVNNSNFPFMNPFLKFETGADYIANATVYFEILHDGNTYEGYVYIRKNYSDAPPIIAWRLGNLFSLTDLFFENERELYIPYDTCFTANMNNSKIIESKGPQDSTKSIVSFEWCRKVGLKSYSLRNGEEYYLKNLYESED